MKGQIGVFLIVVIVLIGLGCHHTTTPVFEGDVVVNGKIVAGSGFGMGVDDSRHLRNWMTQDSVSMVLQYPGSLGWGSVFITVGNPTNFPRPSIDISQYSTLSIEMKSAVDSQGVLIGMKDSGNPDDGTETKKPVYLTQDWKTYPFKLSDFSTCNMTKVYVVTEFVFPCGASDQAATIYVRNISLLRN